MNEMKGTSPSGASDRDLVIAFKQGDGEAYDEIYRRHSSKIRLVCSRRLGHVHDAEEATQETFLRALQALPRFNGQYKLGAWLNRIAINVCIDQLRSRSRADIIRIIEEEALGTERGPDEILNSRRPEVIAALSELKPLHANALRMQAVDGLSHQELAGKLAMSPAQVKALLHRARVAAKRILKDASGFVLAPFTALRKARRQSHAFSASGGAANVMGVLSAVQHQFPAAERLVTGAVVAVLAVGGSSSMQAHRSEIDGRKARPVSVRERDLQTVTQMTPRNAADRSVESDRPKTTQEESVVVVELPLDEGAVQNAADEVVERVERELKTHTKKKGPGGEVRKPTAIKELNQEVRRTAEEADSKAEQIAGEVLGDS